MNAHDESDILGALERSPAVREAVAVMLAALSEAREYGYFYTDTLEVRFASRQQANECEESMYAANKVLDHWIMKESSEDA